MANVTRTVEVKVVAEYWARIELDETELGKTEAELEEMAWREFYDNAHQASIEETSVESDLMTCWECEEDDVQEDHECPEEEEEETCDECGVPMSIHEETKNMDNAEDEEESE